MTKQSKCYVLMMFERIGQDHQIIAVYTSVKAADRNKTAYQRSQEQMLEQRNMYLAVFECPLNKMFE
jgi:hypothetical protein